METWQEWLAERRAASGMSVEPIGLTKVNGWGFPFGDSGGAVARPDGKFFRVTGGRITQGDRSWDQPFLEEYGRGAVVVVFDSPTNSYLLQAKAEPGNNTKLGCVMLAATLQASQSNLEGAGTSRPPRAELLEGREIAWTEIPQDGGRFIGKVNRYAALMADRNDVGDLRSDERWFTRRELKEAVLAGECNEHLLQALALEFVGRR